MTDSEAQSQTIRPFYAPELRGSHPNDVGWNAAIDEIDLLLRCKCPSLDENGFIVEMKNVIAIVRGCKRS